MTATCLKLAYTVWYIEAHQRCGATCTDYCPASRFDSIWYDLIQLTKHDRLDPLARLYAHFNCDLQGRLSRPDRLLTNRCRQDCKQVIDRLPVDLRVERAVQDRAYTLRTAWLRHDYPKIGESQLTARVLGTKHKLLPLGPLFRYCKAAELGWSEVCAKYLNRAAYRYWPLHAYYDKVWQAFIPDTLRDGAERIFWREINKRLAANQVEQ